MTDLNTKSKILDAAEKLFATKGFAATSIRTVIREACVNTAAVHYHFGSREGLIAAVLTRRAAPMNEERLSLLNAVEAAHPSGELPIEDVVESFVGPTVRLHFDPEAGGSMFPRLMSRAIIEANVEIHDMLVTVFGHAFKRYRTAFARALPGLSAPEIGWRMHFLIGALAFTIAIPALYSRAGRDVGHSEPGHKGPPHLEGKFGGQESPELVLKRLVSFVAAGMRASVPAEDHSEAT